MSVALQNVITPYKSDVLQIIINTIYVSSLSSLFFLAFGLIKMELVYNLGGFINNWVEAKGN